MDKAELTKKISKIVEEHIKSGYTQARFLKLIDEYAQQVSREVAEKAFNDARIKIGYGENQYAYSNFDNWQKQK